MHLLDHIRSTTFCLAILLANAGSSHAYEQGSYYVIDLVERAEAQPVAGRLAVPKSVLAGRGLADSPTAPVQEHGEFEIDFSESIAGTNNSAFEFNDPLETETETESTNFSTITFDFGSSNTVIGE